MPECANCGNTVSQQYVRVMAPEGRDTVRTCPDNDCELIRQGAEVRDSRNHTQGGDDYAQKDPNWGDRVATDGGER